MHSLATIANAFVKTSGVEAVSLGGSAALQKADALSDYDLYVYSRTPVPLEVREEIVASRADPWADMGRCPQRLRHGLAAPLAA